MSIQALTPNSPSLVANVSAEVRAFFYFSHPTGATFTTCFNFNPSMDK